MCKVFHKMNNKSRTDEDGAICTCVLRRRFARVRLHRYIHKNIPFLPLFRSSFASFCISLKSFVQEHYTISVSLILWLYISSVFLSLPWVHTTFLFCLSRFLALSHFSSVCTVSNMIKNISLPLL